MSGELDWDQMVAQAILPFKKIILPVYDSSNSNASFIHALKLAQLSHGELEIVDVRSESDAMVHLGVRPVLERWGVLPPGSHRSDVAEIGLQIKKVVKEGGKRKNVIERIDRHAHDLLVIGTESSSTRGTVFGRDMAEYLADYFHQSTLFIGSGARSFVDEQTGAISLDTILLPLDDPQYHHASFEALRRLLRALPGVNPTIVGLHAGSVFPQVAPELLTGLRWQQQVHSGTVLSAILDGSVQHRADLIIMTTKGRDSLVEIFAGSNTEKVLHSAPCPVLSVAVS